METLERHVPQMLLRGEQVAIIVKINWDGEYVLPPRNGHCDVTSRDIMLRRIESSRATLYLHQLYLFFFSFSPPPFCIVFFRAVLSNKRLRCFSLWFITRSWRAIWFIKKKKKWRENLKQLSADNKLQSNVSSWIETKIKQCFASMVFFLSEIKIIHISILIPKDLLYILGSMIPGELWTSSCSCAQQSFHSKKKKKELIYISLQPSWLRSVEEDDGSFDRGTRRREVKREKWETRRGMAKREREREKKKEEKRKETRGGEKKQWLQCNVDGPSLIYSVTIDEEVVEEESKFVIVRLHGVAAVTNSPPPRTVAFSLRRCSSHVNRLFLFLSRVHAECASTEIRKFR